MDVILFRPLASRIALLIVVCLAFAVHPGWGFFGGVALISAQARTRSIRECAFALVVLVACGYGAYSATSLVRCEMSFDRIAPGDSTTHVRVLLGAPLCDAQPPWSPIDIDPQFGPNCRHIWWYPGLTPLVPQVWAVGFDDSGRVVGSCSLASF